MSVTVITNEWHKCDNNDKRNCTNAAMITNETHFNTITHAMNVAAIDGDDWNECDFTYGTIQQWLLLFGKKCERFRSERKQMKASETKGEYLEVWGPLAESPPKSREHI